MNELPEVLIGYRSLVHITTKQSPFALVYGVEAMLPIGQVISTSWAKRYRVDQNEDLLCVELGLLEEKRIEAAARDEIYRMRVMKDTTEKGDTECSMSGTWYCVRLHLTLEALSMESWD